MKIPCIAAGRIKTEFHLEVKRNWETQLVLSIWVDQFKHSDSNYERVTSFVLDKAILPR